MDEVVDVMKANVSRVVERGDRLEDLQDKSGTNVKLSQVLSVKFCFSPNLSV